ncbi:hypothetical protein JTP77_040595, partial [Streptomyces sp. S9]|nr:hypothetical protein [Streptomyces sp. S9]
VPQAGAYADITDYRILDAQSLSGSGFSAVTQNALPFLAASLFTQGNDVFLRLEEANRFNEFPGLPANQQSVANALQALADSGNPAVEQLVAAARGVT